MGISTSVDAFKSVLELKIDACEESQGFVCAGYGPPTCDTKNHVVVKRIDQVDMSD